MKRQIIAVAAFAGLLLAACGDDESTTTTQAPATDAPSTDAPSTDAPSGDAAACAEGKTLEAGMLTIATGDPAYPPYVIDDDPASGQGFEAALAMAVAAQMGFEGDAVSWVRTGFDEAIAPGEKTFDFNLQQYSINAERQQVVTFSDPYYSAPQAAIASADSTLQISTIADLKSLNIGVAAGTTSIDLVENVIQPDSQVQIFNSNADANAALVNGQIDILVVDLPTALYLSAAEFDNAKVIGQFPASAGSEAEPWGMLFAKDNPLVECVNMALANLTASGELATITDTWMGEYTEATEISMG